MGKIKFLTKNIPNFISISRIIVSIILLFLCPFTTAFYILYFYCGFSDVIDGFLARKFKLSSEFGAKIDSVSDIVFVVVCCIKIIPHLMLSNFIIVWMVVIAVIKIFNYVIGYFGHKSFEKLHTIANKITGLFLFCIPFLINLPILIYFEIILCCLATFATLQEFYCIVIKNS